MQALRDWVVAQGGYVGDIAVRGAGGESARGIFATGPISAGCEILRVPRAAWVRPEHEGISALSAGPATAPIRLGARLLARRAGGDPYVRSLPQKVVGHPMALGAGDREALCGTTLAVLLDQLEAKYLEEWRWLQTVPGLEGVSLGTWRATRAVVTSRQFDVGEETVLVPIADMLNHALEPSVDWGVEGDTFVMRVNRDVPADAELHDCYGTKSNTRLFLHYGFTLADNPWEESVLDLGSVGTVILHRSTRTDGAQALLGSIAAMAGGEARERAWGRLVTALRAKLAGMPGSAPEGHPAKGDVDRVVGGEGGGLGYWLAHADLVPRG